MTFLRSLATSIIVVVGGIIFQNQVQAANAGLAASIGPEAASQFDGDNASANVGRISSLPSDQRVLVRQMYFHSFRGIWIMVGTLNRFIPSEDFVC